MADDGSETAPAARRDIVVAGGSAGALAPFQTLVGGLSADFSGTLFIVVHGAPNYRSQVAAILQRETSLDVQDARDGMPILPGRVIVAPSDHHMMLAPGHVHLRRGPLENGFRPALDPLFRSAAVSASTRVTGIVLSGTLDDGASGLRAIRRCGGRALVQDLDEADFSDMPRAAQQAAGADAVLPVAAMPDLLERWVREEAPPPVQAPEDVRIEVHIAALEEATMRNEERLGDLSPFSCPDCSGNLWRIEDGGLVRFRCHTGHAYTADSLAEHQEAALERRLYEVLRGQRERAELLRQMASTGGARARESFERRAGQYEEDADLIERVLMQAGQHVSERLEVRARTDDMEVS